MNEPNPINNIPEFNEIGSSEHEYENIQTKIREFKYKVCLYAQKFGFAQTCKKY